MASMGVRCNINPEPICNKQPDTSLGFVQSSTCTTLPSSLKIFPNVQFNQGWQGGVLVESSSNDSNSDAANTPSHLIDCLIKARI